MRFPHNDVEWETIEIPFSGGVDLRGPARSIQAPRLTKLENGRFEDGVGVRKRRGHIRRMVRTSTSLSAGAGGAGLPGTGLPSSGAMQGSQQGVTTTLTPPANWLYGVGPSDGTTETSDSPDSRFLAGMTKRDNEVLAWDGHRLFSWNAAQEAGKGLGFFGTAMLPSARSETIAKTGTSQHNVDLGIGDNIIVVAWFPDDGEDLFISVYDYTTRAPLLLNESLRITPQHVRVVPMGEWVHILASTVGGELNGYMIHQSKPWEVVDAPVTLGELDTYFDTRKISDTLWAVVLRDIDDDARLTYFNADGTANLTFCAPDTVLETGTPGDVERLAIDFHPQTHEICLLYQSTSAPTSAFRAIYSPAGGAALANHQVVIVGGTEIDKLTVCAEFRTTGGAGRFIGFIQNTDIAGPPSVLSYNLISTDDTPNLIEERHYGVLASHSWRVGDKVFVTLGHGYDPSADTSQLQYSYYICDSDLKPVGRLERGTARSSQNDTVGLAGNGLPSVHFYNGQDEWNRLRFHGPIVYRERLDASVNGVFIDQFDEESIKMVEYDFLPQLRTAQFGGATYIAGAQLHTYDGREVVEAGFHLFPENVEAAVGAAGNLTGIYGYKVRWAHKNAQGEEVVSAALSVSSADLTGDKCNLTIPTLGWTRRSDVYALVYRHNPADTQYYLVSNRDPNVTTGDNACPINDPSTATISFVDDIADADILANERDPGNAGELEPFSASASEIIAAGRDRLWLAGGEIKPGSVLPSKQFTHGRTAQFNTFLTTTVDRGADALTAVAFMNHSIIVFKRDKVFAFEADGPSNFGVGVFDQPRAILSVTGAVSQAGLSLTDAGLLFVSPAGIRLLATNYQLMEIGDPVQSQTSSVCAAVAVPEDQQVRFYQYDGPTLVYDTARREWATWTGLECAGAVRGPSGLAILGRFSGDLWVETDGVWTDAGSGYEYLVRTAQMSRSLLGAQRMRSLALIGDLHGAHTLRVQAFFEERDFPEDEWFWNPTVSGDYNMGTWGDGDWGDGVWGDTNDDGTSDFIETRDYTSKHGLAIQKCSRVAFEFSDMGALTEGPAFTAMAMEIGQRGLLFKGPTRTTT